MEAFFIRALQLILCFSILVLLHEGGHFFFAKLFKVRVEKFSLFFDPWFALAKFKPKHSHTQYTLGWLPLGGYVKIAGMIDESMDKEQMKRPVQPWEFRAKPAWQRLLIMLGGVLVNFFLAFFIYAMVLFTWGNSYVPVENMTNGFKFNKEAKSYGFKDGDVIISSDKGKFVSFDSSESIGDVYRNLSEATSVKVLRSGKSVDINLPGDLNMLDMIKKEPPFITPLIPSVIDSVLPGTPAQKAGIKAGDKVLAFNGQNISSQNDFNEIRWRMQDVLASCSAQDSSRLRNVVLVVRRTGQVNPDTIGFRIGTDYSMGIVWNNPFVTYKKTVCRYGFFESFPAGFTHGWNVLKGYVDDLKYLFTKDGAQSVGSFGTIGSLFPATWQWERFWELTAFISLMLAFMNILPIPALDGGHVLFLLCEVVSGRKPSEKFMERAQMVGMYLLLALMVYAIFNDVMRFVF